MTNREAAKVLLSYLYRAHRTENRPLSKAEEEYLDAICMAIYALMKQDEQHGKHEEKDCEETEPVWHDAETDPPECPGLYYGKKDGTNSMWLCNYAGHTWTLENYRTQKMDIILWADYNEFQ